MDGDGVTDGRDNAEEKGGFGGNRLRHLSFGSLWSQRRKQPCIEHFHRYSSAIRAGV